MKRTFEQQIYPTPKELADCFWDMDATEQADFFNYLHKAVELQGSLPMQLQYVSDSKNLTPEGKSVMSLIGDYSR